MPNLSEVMAEVHQLAVNGDNHALDTYRRRWLATLSGLTGRNTIIYYSGWLQGRNSPNVFVNDKDKNAFMATIYQMDRSKGLDLVLHTPGGDLAAAESIVDYLHSMFGKDIRAIIPQISMSAGTLIAMSCKEVVMGKQSNLGPIDPQMGGIPCQGVISEFERAKAEVAKNPSSAALWQVIISKYHPTFLGTCANAIKWSEELAREWLTRNMCEGHADVVEQILREFNDHDNSRSHSRHLSTQKCKDLGMTIVDMEHDQKIQEAMLTLHHATMHTLANSMVSKLVENHLGIAYIEVDQLPKPIP